MIKLLPKRTDIAGRIPTGSDLMVGEIAINSSDKILFTKVASGDVVNLSGAPMIHTHPISDVSGLQDALNSKVDKISGMGLSSEDYTAEEKSKLGGIEDGAEVNVATNLGQTRSLSDYTITSSTGSNTTLQPAAYNFAGVMAAGDKSKLDGIEASAQVNVATNLGQTVDGVSYTITSSTGNSTIINSVTQTTAGVMAAGDKSKLDGIEASAQVNTVDTVNAKTGAVVLGTDDVSEGISNLYYTDVRATSAIKNDPDWKDTNWNTAYGWGDHSLAGYEFSSNKGVANGYAGLGGDGKVPSAQLPSFVDDVLEYSSETAFPTTGEAGKMYVALDTNKVYRWSGTTYVYITSGAVDTVNGKDGVVVLSTSDISEGTHQYFTTARARGSISVSGDLSYSAGVISFSESYSTPNELLTAIKTVDGSGSGLDADTLDGVNSTQFVRSDTNDTLGGILTLNAGTTTTAPLQFPDNNQWIWKLSAFDVGMYWNTTNNYIDIRNTYGDLLKDGNLVYHAGNTGVGSGLDADLLDGRHGAYYRNASNLNAGTIAEARLPASALIGDTAYTAGTGLTLTGTSFSLSGEQFTSTLKNKLDGIQTGAQVNVGTNLGQSKNSTSYTITSSTGSNTTISSASTTVAGVMTAADKEKLDGIDAGATAGTPVTSVNSKTGAVTITASDVGLGSVRNVASYSQTEANNRFVNDTGDSMTGSLRINHADDGVSDLQVGGDVAFGSNVTTTGTSTASKFKTGDCEMVYNSALKSMEFNFT